MNEEAGPATVMQDRSNRLPLLAAWGLVSWLLYLGVALLSRQFAYGAPLKERPILEVLLLFAAAFGCYLVALRTALRCRDSRRLLGVILLFAVGFRGLLLFSVPIQEVDIYRYVWDGSATAAGVNPYRYSPQQVREATPTQRLPDDFRRLVALRDSSPGMRRILDRVHYGHLPTVYPPVSQAVFTAAALTTPADASVRTHLLVMTGWLLLFDLGTLWILLRILVWAGKPLGWAVAYGWCPLVLKEFTNSGHLDAIAVCLTTLAVYLTLRSFEKCRESVDGGALAAGRELPMVRRLLAIDSGRSMICALASAIVLALAVGAKLYPVVLAPLLGMAWLRRFGLRRTFAPAGVFVVLTGLLFVPMLLGRPDPHREERAARSEKSAGTQSRFSPLAHRSSAAPEPPPSPSIKPQDPGRGLRTFLARWEMNDFLFLMLVENLKPDAAGAGRAVPWFRVVPAEWRDRFASATASALSLDRARVPFLATRLVTGLLSTAICLWWSVRGGRPEAGRRFLEAAFLILAWFWLLLPTQNPWYWIWALPLVPFARSRAWLALSGLVFLYYTRFWLGYHWPETQIAFTPYPGTRFFDFVVTWLEFGPWFVWLAVDYRRYQRPSRTGSVCRTGGESGGC